MSDLPYGVKYRIDGKNDRNGREGKKHVHIEGNGCSVKYDLDGNYMAGHLGGSVKEKDIINWIRDHKQMLSDEWDRKSY